jgi:phosphate/sulfate permease
VRVTLCTKLNNTTMSDSDVTGSTTLHNIVVASGVLSLCMAWTIGAQDVAAMATSVGAKALSLRQAILWGGICEFLGYVRSLVVVVSCCDHL